MKWTETYLEHRAINVTQMIILDTARKILHEGPICDQLPGRQFAKLSTGLSNDMRGAP